MYIQYRKFGITGFKEHAALEQLRILPQDIRGVGKTFWLGGPQSGTTHRVVSNLYNNL